jgi:hypothetical protein
VALANLAALALQCRGAMAFGSIESGSHCDCTVARRNSIEGRRGRCKLESWQRFAQFDCQAENLQWRIQK